ncbi:MAG: hypothetical protein ACREMO_01710, partial [Gemmatimonadales bacterium]
VLGGGPTLDAWTIASFDGRISLGGQARLALRIPLGRWEVENTASVGWSQSPFTASDIPPGVELRTLRSQSLAWGIRYRL